MYTRREKHPWRSEKHYADLPTESQRKASRKKSITWILMLFSAAAIMVIMSFLDFRDPLESFSSVAVEFSDQLGRQLSVYEFDIKLNLDRNILSVYVVGVSMQPIISIEGDLALVERLIYDAFGGIKGESITKLYEGWPDSKVEDRIFVGMSRVSFFELEARFGTPDIEIK